MISLASVHAWPVVINNICVPQTTGRNKPCCCEFLSIIAVCHMPALFAYLLAITTALGGGYAGLRWLAAPDSTSQQSSASAKLPSKGKKLPEKSNVTTMTEAESGPKD